jgi:pantoate kinase
MAVSASCPGYLTGIFVIGENDAAGAGFAIDKSLTTTVSEKASGRATIAINGIEAPASVSKSVLRRYSELGMRPGLLDIRHTTEVPIGYGLGMSAAGALSLSLCLNELLGAGLSREKCIKIAHDADAECGTGLSGVDAAAIGGILARRSVGEAPVQMPFVEKELEIAFYSPIRTSDVIRSQEWKTKVNAAGNAALQLLFANQAWDGFLACCRQFSKSSGLSDWCSKEMASNPRASMAMLGHTVFSDIPLFLPHKPFMLMKAKTCQSGAKML